MEEIDRETTLAVPPLLVVVTGVTIVGNLVCALLFLFFFHDLLNLIMIGHM
jgi:hypothetical protein